MFDCIEYKKHSRANDSCDKHNNKRLEQITRNRPLEQGCGYS